MYDTQVADKPKTYQQENAVPTRKVAVGAVGGAFASIAVFTLNTFVLSPEKQIPAEIAAASTTILTFVIAYFVPPAANDQVVTQ